MPDRLQPIQDANDAYKDVMRLLREVGRMQDKQLAKAKQFNIENQLLSEIKKSHLTDEQRLLSIQTSVVEKTKVMVELEGSRRDLLRAGYATTSVEILPNIWQIFSVFRK